MKILLVEDDSFDAQVFMEACREIGFKGECVWLTDGDKALNYLLRQGEFVDAATPGLVVLDLGLPRINGHEVLKTLLGHKEMDIVPVVVFSTSTREEDKEEAISNNARAYFSKPYKCKDYNATVGCILTYCSADS